MAWVWEPKAHVFLYLPQADDPRGSSCPGGVCTYAPFLCVYVHLCSRMLRSLRDCNLEVFSHWSLPHLPLISCHQLQLIASSRVPYLRVWLRSSWRWILESDLDQERSVFFTERNHCWERKFLELLLSLFYGHLHCVGFRENCHGVTVLGFASSCSSLDFVNKFTVHHKSPAFGSYLSLQLCGLSSVACLVWHCSNNNYCLNVKKYSKQICLDTCQSPR